MQSLGEETASDPWHLIMGFHWMTTSALDQIVELFAEAQQVHAETEQGVESRVGKWDRGWDGDMTVGRVQ